MLRGKCILKEKEECTGWVDIDMLSQVHTNAAYSATSATRLLLRQKLHDV
jgi:hypothetical protein